jgi:hypothetical protein
MFRRNICLHLHGRRARNNLLSTFRPTTLLFLSLGAGHFESHWFSLARSQLLSHSSSPYTFLERLILLHWRYRQQVPLKHWHIFTKLHGGIYQETVILVLTALRTLQTKLCGFSPQASYTNRATAACRRSCCQLLRMEGVAWSAQRIPTVVNLDFLDSLENLKCVKINFGARNINNFWGSENNRPWCHF